MRDHPGLVESCLVDVSIFLNFQKLRKNSIYIKYVSSQKRESKLAGIKFILFRTRNRIRASIKLYLSTSDERKNGSIRSSIERKSCFAIFEYNTITSICDNLRFSHVNLNTVQGTTRSDVIWKSTGIVHRARNYRDRRGIDKRVRAAEARN